MDMEPIVEDQVSMTIDNDDVVSTGSNSDEFISLATAEFSYFTAIGMVRVGKDTLEHEILKRIFLSGMGSLANAEIVAIHKNSVTSLTKHARLESFRIFSDAMKAKSGGSNTKIAWYGGSRDAICEIISHGFSNCEPPANSVSYGVGVNLFPSKYSIDAALLSTADERALRHVLFCRVLLGKMEAIRPGSRQSYPTSIEFDSGVDNLSAPTRYIVWTAFMNSHIFPNYIITFNSPQLNGIHRTQPHILRPTSSWMSFPTLISVLSRFLDRSRIASIVKFHDDFRVKRITKQQLINEVKQLTGEGLLIAALKPYRSKAPLV